MLLKFAELVIKTRERDDQNWHTANQKLPSPAHRRKPTLANGCRQEETIDASSLPDVDAKKHPPSAVMVLPQPTATSGAGTTKKQP
jgi:hypothetical protein